MTSRSKEVKIVYKCLFEHRKKEELIYVWYEDLDGYITYEKCMDCLQTKRKMTPVELYRDYKRVWEC